jgi:SAM-dependent methyltransferase
VEDEDSRLVLHQLEYDLTWRYLTRYLPPAGSILEIGAGTGRYTLALCRRGYSVTAVDLSAALLQRCKLRLEASRLHGQVQFVVADARDLHAVPTTAFDAVLLMGPLYLSFYPWVLEISKTMLPFLPSKTTLPILCKQRMHHTITVVSVC